MKGYLNYILILVIALLSSCQYFQKKEGQFDQGTKSILARVGDKYLYEEELSDILSEDLGPKDSTQIIHRYVNSWVRKMLLIEKAQKNLDYDIDEINRKVENYRYELMMYEYKKAYVNEKLNTDVTDKDIEKFYKENIDNFQLRFNIVRCHFVKLPKNSPKLSQAKKWFYSNKNTSIKKFKEYSLQHAVSHSFEDSLWIKFSEVTRGTPFRSNPNDAQFLKENKRSITSDASFVYLLKVIDYKFSDEASPLEFVKDNIKNIIVNKRKIEVIEALEDGIFEQAKENKGFETYY